MRLKFISASDSDRKAKATVHASGKIGFSSDANKMLSLKDGQYIGFAINEENTDEKNLYAEIYEDAKEGALKINRAGSYFYVNTKSLFDGLGVDYRASRVIYDIARIQYDGKEIIKLIKREAKKKPKTL